MEHEQRGPRADAQTEKEESLMLTEMILRKNSPRCMKPDLICVFDITACLPDLIIRLLYLLLADIVAAGTAGLRRARLVCAWESRRGLRIITSG